MILVKLILSIVILITRVKVDNYMKIDNFFNSFIPWYIIWVFPELWIYILGGNFILDSVIFLSLISMFNIQKKLNFYVENIFSLFVIGLLLDGLATGFILVIRVIFDLGSMFYPSIVLGILLSGTGMFLMCYFAFFSKEEQYKRVLMSILFALFSAPYTYFIS